MWKKTNDQKFRTRKWDEVNDYQNNGEYYANSQIKFNTTMLKPSLCDHSDACILVKETITINGARADTATNKQNTS